MLLIFLLNPINSDARAGAHLLPAALAKVAFLLKFKARKLLTTWLSQLPPDVLGGRALRPLQRHLTSYVEVTIPLFDPPSYSCFADTVILDASAQQQACTLSAVEV